MVGLHVVVGAGVIGGEVVRLLAQQSRRVRVVTRSGAASGLPDLPGVEHVAADATDADRLAELSSGAAALYNCVNPPYHRWAELWPPLGAAALDAAERSGAVLATCANLYGYGPVDGPMTEDLPLAATHSKGRVRAEQWRLALRAHEGGRVRATEVRPSDFVGPGAQSALMRTLPRVLAGRSAQVLGDPDSPHSWTYPVDVARTLVTVAADARAWGRPWHVPTNAPRSARQALTDLAAAAGLEPPRLSVAPRALLRVMGLANPSLREVLEVMYQYDRPFVVDDRAARTRFGLEPTPWADVVSATVRGPEAAAA